MENYDKDPELKKVVSKSELIEFQKLVKRVPVADNVIEYAISKVKETRPTESKNAKMKQWINWGAGPRASQYLIIAAKAKAIMDGRYTPNIDDVKYSLIPVLRHRIIPNFNAEADGITSLDIINNLMTD